MSESKQKEKGFEIAFSNKSLTKSFTIMFVIASMMLVGVAIRVSYEPPSIGIGVIALGATAWLFSFTLLAVHRVSLDANQKLHFLERKIQTRTVAPENPPKGNNREGD